MKEHPMLFNGPMVRAILSGAKTQTRRLIALNEKTILSMGQRKTGFTFSVEHARVGDVGRMVAKIAGVNSAIVEQQISIPVRHPTDEHLTWEGCGYERVYSPWEVGDRIWVRETWGYFGGDEYLYQRDPGSVGYRASHSGINPIPGGKWRPSIHMPRWASRITLEVTGVRVERVNEISEEDAKAEGFKGSPEYKWWQYITTTGSYETSRDVPQNDGDPFTDWVFRQERSSPAIPATRGFQEIWQSTYPGTWENNSWVWVIEFRRVV